MVVDHRVLRPELDRPLEMADRVLKLRSGEIVDDLRNASPIAAGELTW